MNKSPAYKKLERQLKTAHILINRANASRDMWYETLTREKKDVEAERDRAKDYINHLVAANQALLEQINELETILSD